MLRLASCIGFGCGCSTGKALPSYLLYWAGVIGSDSEGDVWYFWDGWLKTIR